MTAVDMRRAGLVVLALTVLACLLRLPGLNSTLWYDEILSVVESVRPPLSTIVTTYHDSNHHPLYAVMSHLSISMLGEQPWTVRLPALLVGVAAIPALYLLGTVVANRREALLATVLLATSYHHIWFSQNARGYSALLLFTLLATWTLLRGLEERKTWWFVAYGILSALGAYTHLTMVFVVMAQTLVSMGIVLGMPRGEERTSTWRLAVLGTFVAATATVVLYAPMIPDMYAVFVEAPPPTRDVATPSLAAEHAIRGLQVGLNTVGMLLGAFLGMIGVWSYAMRQRTALALFLLPGVALGAAALGLGLVLRPRFFFLLIGFLLLLIARGAVRIGGWVVERVHVRPAPDADAAVAWSLALALVVIAIPSVLHNYRVPKQDFDSARAYIAAHRLAGDPVVTAGTASYPYQRYYAEDWDAIRSRDEFDRFGSLHRRFWIVYSQPEYLERSLRAAIEESCLSPRVFSGTLDGGDVVVCDAFVEPRAAWRAGGRP